MMRRLLTLCFLMVVLGIELHAQTVKYGKVLLTEEPEILKMVTENEKDFEGYRIQVFTGNANEREKAQEIKSFIEKNFNVKAYVNYESPLFKVRVGDFTDKIEAVKLKHQMEKYYKNTYITKVPNVNL